MFLITDICLVLLFLGGYLARYVSPRHVWWFQVLALGLPMLSILVGGFGLWALFTRHFHLVGLHAVLGLLIALRFWPSSYALPAQETHAELTVLSYNVKLRDGERSERDLDRFIDEVHPHVIAMQESPVHYSADPPIVAMAPQVRIVLAGGTYTTQPPGISGSTQGRLAGEEGTPVPILSRIASRIAWSAPVLEKLYLGEGRDRAHAASRAVLNWQGRDIAVYSVHLRSFDPDGMSRGGSVGRVDPRGWLALWRRYRDDFVIRAEQARQLRALLESETLPFIVCGDFNSTPHNWVYAHLSRGLQDAFRRAGEGSGATFPVWFVPFRIDYILASPEWTVHAASAIDVAISDHRPVFGRFSISAQ